MKRLHLGCGEKPLQGYENVDVTKYAGVDTVADLDKPSWPWPDNYADEILMEHVLEHLHDWPATLREIWRVAKPNAIVDIKVPHFSFAWANPDHKQAFGRALFYYYNRYPYLNMGRPFRVEKSRFVWTKVTVKEYPFLRPLNGLINLAANASQRICERIWCYWVGGFEEIHFIVRPEKSKDR